MADCYVFTAFMAVAGVALLHESEALRAEEDAVRDFLARESGRIELRFRSQADAGQPFRAADFVIRLPASAAVAG